MGLPDRQASTDSLSQSFSKESNPYINTIALRKEAQTLLQAAVRIVWGPWTLALFLAVGLRCSLGSGFFQLFGVRRWWRGTLGGLGAKNRTEGGLSPLETLSTALASTVGTGSIVGVATAITWGGPGAIFWMWVSAFLSAMTGWTEKALSVLVRRRRNGAWEGGPMVWLEEKGLTGAARSFALFTALAALGMGDMVQANSLAAAVETSAGIPPLATGLVTAAACGLVLMGGVQGVGRLCEKLVPVMAVLFLAGGCVTLFHARGEIPEALLLILRSALTPEAAQGGLMGSAVRWGVARGVCTNEAGLGSTALVHCSSANTDPVREGYWGILEVFLSTFVICTITALAVLTSDAYRSGTALTGAALSVAAFTEGLGRAGPGFVALCLAVFAFSTLLGWCWYGCCGVRYLLSERWEKRYRLLFLACIVAGSVARLEAVWQFSDICNGLMAWPSLIALLIYAPQVLPLLREENGGNVGTGKQKPDAGVKNRQDISG